MGIIATTERLLLRTLNENDREHILSIHVFEKLGAVYQRSTTYLPADMLERMQRELPDSDFGVLLQNSVREYTLELPIC